MRNTQFEIGEKVVCLNAKRRLYNVGGLTENEIYTIIGFNPFDGGLILRELKSPNSGFRAYARDRFRKLDYSFVDQILESITPKEEEIVDDFEGFSLN